jgi:hypothetical protein
MFSLWSIKVNVDSSIKAVFFQCLLSFVHLTTPPPYQHTQRPLSTSIRTTAYGSITYQKPAMQSPGGGVGVAATAPRRCFCGEVQQYLQPAPLMMSPRQQQTASKAAGDNSSNSNTPRKLRVMGTLVQIHKSSSVVHGLEDYPHTIFLDDGTGTPPPMAASESMVTAVHVGQTVDCVVRCCPDINTNNNFLVIESLTIHNDDEQALALRSLEIVHARKGFPGRTWGLPPTADVTTTTESTEASTVMPTLTTDDLHNLIVAEPEVGVHIEDLKEFFHVDDQIHERIQELQMQGLIYQSQSGAYLPL